MPASTQAAYDRWAETYDTERNPQIVMEHDDVVALVDPHSGDSILDAACGTGKYTIEFHMAGADVVGIDFSQAMLDRAVAKYPHLTFKVADLLEPLPFGDSSFDKINCAQALTHLPNLTTPFVEFARVLRSGGSFTFSVTHPDMHWDDYEIDDKIHVDIRVEDHPHRFCDYFEALDRAGLALDRLVQIPVSEKIKDFLTPKSYPKVEGRYQVLAIRARKDGI